MKMFVMQWPWVLWGLVLAVPLGLILASARGKRRRLVKQMGAAPPQSRRCRDGLRLASLILLVLAVARPGFDPQRRAVSQSGRDIVFAIDVSRSMLAPDAHPSRLEAAKQGVRDALEGFGTERVGLVIYAGSATILCPLTFDYDFVRYMLDQATPRAVDFGGTTLLAAVEKTVDNLFTQERAGMQDLVVLTDGEDHGPDMSRVAQLLKENGVDLLLLGLGDASSGSRIPVEDEGGGTTYLKHKGEIITTRLDDASLRGLAESLSGAEYVAPGSAAFDLGGIYADYAMERPAASAVGGESFVVYREAGFHLVALALVMLVVAEWRAMRCATAALAGLVMTSAPVKADEGWLVREFREAARLQEAGKIDEALEKLGVLDAEAATPAQRGAMRFNQGLCHLARAAAQETAAASLAEARQARLCFLQATRMGGADGRAGPRLDGTAAMIVAYEEQARQEEERQQEMQKQVNELIERLERLRDAETNLRGEVHAADPGVKLGPAPGRGPPQPPVIVPQNVEAQAKGFAGRQEVMRSEGRSIHRSMEGLDQAMTPPPMEGVPRAESVLAEPLRLMTQVVAAQGGAVDALAAWDTWELARARQQEAVVKIQEILDLLAGDNEGESEDGDPEDFEEDWDMEDYEEGEQGTPSSADMTGDLASGGEMQPLPLPNYSVEDVLMEEQGNMQFRQQERAKANAGKVEKDW
jgi:hypothetical protein